jgi:hypothetical protein
MSTYRCHIVLTMSTVAEVELADGATGAEANISYASPNVHCDFHSVDCKTQDLAAFLSRAVGHALAREVANKMEADLKEISPKMVVSVPLKILPPPDGLQ